MKNSQPDASQTCLPPASNLVVEAPGRTTVPVTMEQIIYHGEIVVRAVERALVVVDMPFLSYHVSIEKSVENAGRVMKETGCQAVKLEGGERVVPQAEAIGLRIPDDELTWNEERGHYDFGEIDWDEFMRVISGSGLCNRQRLGHHTKAHDENAWVREAMWAYARKQSE